MWNHKVKVALTSAFLLAVVLALSAGYPGGLAAPVSAAGGCDLKTLEGAYGNSFQFLNTDPANAGTPIGVGTHTPGAGVGVVSFDGKGNFSGHATISTSGLILRPVLETGTYTVNSDCTGALDLTIAGQRALLDIVIADHGNEVFTLSTQPGDIAIGRLRKQ